MKKKSLSLILVAVVSLSLMCACGCSNNSVRTQDLPQGPTQQDLLEMEKEKEKEIKAMTESFIQACISGNDYEEYLSDPDSIPDRALYSVCSMLSGDIFDANIGPLYLMDYDLPRMILERCGHYVEKIEKSDDKYVVRIAHAKWPYGYFEKYQPMARDDYNITEDWFLNYNENGRADKALPELFARVWEDAKDAPLSPDSFTIDVIEKDGKFCIDTASLPYGLIEY